MQVTQDCLVVSVQVELYEETLLQMREDMLHRVHQSNVHKAIIDLSSVDLIDAYSYEHICDTANMAKVMGTHTIVAGIQPGSASALVELGVRVGTVEIALNMEDGFQRLANMSDTPHQIDLTGSETTQAEENNTVDAIIDKLADTETPSEDLPEYPPETLPDRNSI
ncbi:MAG: STAS domain-containing protein [Hyphomicrobiales bacterium]